MGVEVGLDRCKARLVVVEGENELGLAGVEEDKLHGWLDVIHLQSIK